MNQVFITRTHRDRSRVAEFILNQPEDVALQVTVEKFTPVRSNTRNAQLHAVIGDIAKQKQWDGEWLSIEQFKRLLVAGWMRATGRKVKLVRAIEGGSFEPLYQRTSRLSEAECRDLIAYVYAWGVDQGVKFTEPQRQENVG